MGYGSTTSTTRFEHEAGFSVDICHSCNYRYYWIRFNNIHGRKHRQHQLLSQQIEDMTLINNTERVRHEHIVQAHSDYKRMRINEIENNWATITAAETFPKNIYWNNFDKMCQIVDDNFYMLASKLRKKNILNETEIRLCILVLLNLNRADTSKTIPYALSSVGKLKDYTAKKLNTSGKNLREYLINMAVGI